MNTQAFVPPSPTCRPRLRRRIAIVAVGVLASAAAALAAPTGAGAATGNAALVGHFDSVSVQAGQVSMHGWAADTRTPLQSINVGYSIATGTKIVVGAIRSHDLRADVGRAYPSLGNYHGFNATNYVAPGTYSVCAWAMDPVGGANQPIGCQTARVPVDIRPRGHLDSVASLGSGRIHVRGWAVDDNTPTTPVGVGIFLGSATGPDKSVPVTANQLRPDVAAAFPRIGANHGFSATILARPGTQAVCAWANNTYIYGAPTLLGCLNVTV